MFDVADQRGSVDPGSGRIPLRTILSGVALACLLLSGSAFAPPAKAGGLYRCVGATGETAYSTSTGGFEHCRKMGNFAAPAAASARVLPVRRASLALATGAATTTAQSLEADGALPTSLAHVQGDAQTNAQVLATAEVQRPSLVNASASVTTTAAATAALRELPAAGHALASIDLTAPVPTGEPQPAEHAGGRVLRGAVYRIAHADGSIEYTNVRPGGSRAGHLVTMLFTYIDTCAACDLHSPIQWNRVALNLTDYAQAVHAASAAYGVDEAFLRAVIHAESAFNPRAMSIKGAQGLMQLMPATASDLGVLDAFDSDQNIRGGARYLGSLLHDFDGDEQLAAAAYNAGPTAVQRYGGVPPYAETRVYVQRVATLRKRYAAAIHPVLTARVPGGATAGM